MTKQNSWLTKQFQAASTEVNSWSASKQTAMSNALKSIDNNNTKLKPPTVVAQKNSTIKI